MPGYKFIYYFFFLNKFFLSLENESNDNFILNFINDD